MTPSELKIIAQLKSDHAMKISDTFLDNQIGKDQKFFWKTWKAKVDPSKPMSRSIDGLTNQLDIANTFGTTFANNCSPYSSSNSFSSYNELQKNCLIIIPLIP